MSGLGKDPRWAHARDARWFAGKGRGGTPVALDPLDWFVPPGPGAPGVRSEILTVAYPDSSREFYQLLVSYRAQPLSDALIGPTGELGFAHDATKDPGAIAALMTALHDAPAGNARTGSDGTAGPQHGPSWSAHLVAPEVLSRPLAARPFHGEQSNSTVFLGDEALVKFFRRLEAGRNIDIEMHEALGRGHVDEVDALYGWVDAALPPGIAGAGARADLLMISEELAVRDEGWQLAVAASSAGTDFSALAGELGVALARVHAALARTLPTGRLDGDAVARAMTARLDAAAAQVPQLRRHRERITALFDRLRGRTVPCQRIHGDFHLGQTLLTRSGWKIIDWEGEPLKSLTQRAQPDSVWRDVAGMLRSFGYARAVGAGTRRWQRDAADCFMSGYRSGAETPADTDTLNAYVVDKAIYEVIYETHNRPDWAHIPMQAVVDVIDAPHGTATRRPDDGS